MKRPPRPVLVVNTPDGVDTSGDSRIYRSRGEPVVFANIEDIRYIPSTASDEMMMLRSQKRLTIGCLARALGISVAAVSGGEASSRYSEVGFSPASYAAICDWLRTIPDRGADAPWLLELCFDD